MANVAVSSAKHSAIVQWVALTAYSVGNIRRQLAAPAAGSERAFRCTTAGTSGATEPLWTLTAGSTTADGTVVWTEETGLNANGWNAAHARLRNALATGWSAAGDSIYCGSTHSDTEAANITLTSPGTAASPCHILSVSDAAWPPTTLAAGAAVATTGANDISFAGFADTDGVYFSAGSGTSNGGINFNATTPWAWLLNGCRLILAGNTSGSRITVGNNSTGIDDQLLRLVNTSLKFAHASQGVVVRSQFEWSNSVDLVAAGTVPTTLFLTPSNVTCGDAVLTGVDLSSFAAAKNLISVSAGSFISYHLRRCKLGASVAVTTGTPVGQGGVRICMRDCDSAGTNYRIYDEDYGGAVQQETTIVRTGGASDGTTAFSRKAVTSAGASLEWPLLAFDAEFWNDSTGSSLTATAETVTDNVTLTDAEAWIEIEYPAAATSPLASFVTDRVASRLATPANQTSSSETWTTTGLATPIKQALSAAFTPALKGPVRVRVYIGKPSTTVYVCPKITITSRTSSRQHMAGHNVFQSENTAGGGGVSKLVGCGGLVG